MADDLALTPREAEAVVDERIEQFGLDALPRVTVATRSDGTWLVRWQHIERIVEPMARDAWSAWLRENVGSLDAGDLATTES